MWKLSPRELFHPTWLWAPTLSLGLEHRTSSECLSFKARQEGQVLPAACPAFTLCPTATPSLGTRQALPESQSTGLVQSLALSRQARPHLCDGWARPLAVFVCSLSEPLEMETTFTSSHFTNRACGGFCGQWPFWLQAAQLKAVSPLLCADVVALCSSH